MTDGAEATGAITTPAGFRAAGVPCGIKPNRPDLAVIVADVTGPAAAVFTTNLAQAAPVLVSRDHLRSGRARAVVVNAGCANAATGERGLADARETARLAAEAAGCAPDEVVVASTGVIGAHLPMDKLRAGVPAAFRAASRSGGAAAARAILTTDTKPKEAVVRFEAAGRTASIGVMGKGAGMIAPNMATMLVFFTTDAWVEPTLLHRGLKEACDATLNRITVDGDTSTNDMALILSAGAGTLRIESEGEAYRAFVSALTEAARQIAVAIVRDGEGATRFAEVTVEGARTAEDAHRLAKTIAESPLVKTAINGGDANWGRVLAAAGRAGVPLDINKVDVFLGDVWVAEGGAVRAYDEAAATAAFAADPVRIRVRLGAGTAAATMWTCDLSHGYVDINGSYRS